MAPISVIFSFILTSSVKVTENARFIFFSKLALSHKPASFTCEEAVIPEKTRNIIIHPVRLLFIKIHPYPVSVVFQFDFEKGCTGINVSPVPDFIPVHFTIMMMKVEHKMLRIKR
jgi:hypothetical protein